MNSNEKNQDFEYQKWIHQANREDANRIHDKISKFVADVNEAAIKSSEIALRAAILINGGAAVSLLAFIGSIISKEQVENFQIINRFLNFLEIKK